MNAMIGILGGMGPLATVDFLSKLVQRTPASCDQDHVPVVVYSVPQIPDRSASILRGGESPLPAHACRHTHARACRSGRYCDSLQYRALLV